MTGYSAERKAAVLKKLLPPGNLSVAELSRQEGISDVTLYTWRRQAMGRGEVVSWRAQRGAGKLPEQWPAEAKLAVVIETAALSAIEQGQYCREKGLYPEQIKAWRQACLDGQVSAVQQLQSERAQARTDRKRIQELERELNRKEKALAEAAALLVLRKKLHALWGEDGDS
jgi:transposase-like protein